MALSNGPAYAMQSDQRRWDDDLGQRRSSDG
jgi:hypothetical protein